jgi:hypothetical protein
MRKVLVYGSTSALAAVLALAAACGDTTYADGPDAAVDANAADVPKDRNHPAFDGGEVASGSRVKVLAETETRTVQIEDLMFAAGEMQISGEPFAEGFAGRDLGGYDRTRLPTNLYVVRPGTEEEKTITDLFGFGTAVESYEYSKYHMLQTALQSTAGVALARGPLVAKFPGADVLERMRNQGALVFGASGADVAGLAIVPAPVSNVLNYFGFRGMWPAFLPYKSMEPTIAADGQVVRSCTFTGGYGGIPTLSNSVPEYECSYDPMHLPDRDAQVEKTLVPSTIGLSTWKQALWSIDFVGRLHDSTSNEVTAVANQDLLQVGIYGNSITATAPAGASPGTFIGSTPLEGSWGLMMMTNMDNAAEYLLSSLLTTDGQKLTAPFATRADALAYDYSSPLAWFPASVNVTEDGTKLVYGKDAGTNDPTNGDPFPAVVSLAIKDPQSRSRDLAALLLGHAMFFGMSDARNAGIGQRIGLQLAFDGSPFAKDNGLADGEDSAHDRALAIMRIAFIDLDRIHRDPALHVLHDSATMDAVGTVKRGGKASTTEIAHSVIALRQALLSLNGKITQYGAADPSIDADNDGILNGQPFHPRDGAENMSGRVRRLITENAAFVRDVLTTADGTVRNSASIALGVATVDSSPATLESQAAAVRALTEGFLVTRDESFRTRARAVAQKLDVAFYDTHARMHRGVAGGPTDVHMTPWRFGWLLSALRETYKVLYVEGDPALDRAVVSDRVARSIKLYLNGWDDLNGNQIIEPSECLPARMQLGEQPLTGELGLDSDGPSSDRDGDCVLEIDDAKSASVLAGAVHFHAAN